MAMDQYVCTQLLDRRSQVELTREMQYPQGRTAQKTAAAKKARKTGEAALKMLSRGHGDRKSSKEDKQEKGNNVSDDFPRGMNLRVSEGGARKVGDA